MNRLLLCACLLSGCATTTPPPSREPETPKTESKDAAMGRYVNCTLDYANQYVTSSASASEIADAAVATCEKYLLELQRIYTVSMVGRYETQAGTQTAERGVKELIRDLRSKKRGLVISKVLELGQQKNQ
jgi:hypothetical protein